MGKPENAHTMPDAKQAKWTKERIYQLLDENDKAVKRAVLAIYRRQTADERSVHGTRHVNGVGFNKMDANFMTAMAVGILDEGKPGARPFTPKMLEASRRGIKKYWRQLLIEIERLQEGKQAEVLPVDQPKPEPKDAKVVALPVKHRYVPTVTRPAEVLKREEITLHGQRVEVFEYEAGKYYVEASDLQLTPGEWPIAMAAPRFGNGQSFLFMRNTSGGCEYRQAAGGIELLVFND